MIENPPALEEWREVYKFAIHVWFLEANEARLIMYVLEQTLDAALRYREDESLLETSDEKSYLVRVPHKEDGILVWEDRIMRVPPPEPAHIPIAMNTQEIEVLKRLPQIGEEGTRLFIPICYC